MKPTLGQVFVLSLLALAAALAGLFFVVFSATRDSIVESSERIRQGASREISERALGFLAKAPETVGQFQRELKSGLVDPVAPGALEPALFTLLLATPDLSEVTLTYGAMLGFDKAGDIRLAPEGCGEWSVVRTTGSDGETHYFSRHVYAENGRYIADIRDLHPGLVFAAVSVTREQGPPLPNPTLHPTFTTPARKELYGTLCPSDLHWSQLDADLPVSRRRVEVSVQQVVVDAAGKFLGVLRVGLLTQQINGIIQMKLAPAGMDDPHRIFICDKDGRLIAPAERLEESEDDLRVAPTAVPPVIADALATPQLAQVDSEHPTFSGSFRRAGETYLTTFRALPGLQEWIIGIVVPQSWYLGKLVGMRDRLLLLSSGIIVALIAGGGLILRAVKRAQAQIRRESLRMNSFEFAPASTDSPFRDVSEVLESLEKAKTAMRAMGKYVPIDLVRRLYCEKSEPVLGGELIEVSILFTDIKDFSSASERLRPDQLADALGRYLDIMARLIQESGGTIDKYIGDSIMTLWNVPERVEHHARRACSAALRCRDASHALSQAPDWAPLPPFETRFGLHRAKAIVGHFGAHDRMNYTAIGDSVNLASRLEGLNKQYGTSIIASDCIVEQARDYFEFRLLDFVAVKGKEQPVEIYELLDEKGKVSATRRAAADAYEKAFTAYLARDFQSALDIVAANDSDPPGAVLAGRCRAFLEEPPPGDWRGVHISTMK